MEKIKKQGFWRGEVADKLYAERICRNIANVWLVLGIGGAVSQLTNHPVDVADIISFLCMLLIIVTPSLFLRQKYSLIAARMLLGISVFCLGTFVILIASSLYKGEMPMAVIGLVLTPIWGLSVVATSRACSAAKYLRSHKQQPIR